MMTPLFSVHFVQRIFRQPKNKDPQNTLLVLDGQYKQGKESGTHEDSLRSGAVQNQIRIGRMMAEVPFIYVFYIGILSIVC